MFRNAPALADGVPAGITLHLDGGAGKDTSGNPFSVNFGINGSMTAPGVNERSLADVNKNYFGNDSKNARELAFHYSVFADFWGTANNSAGVAFTGSVHTATANSISTTSPFPSLNGKMLLITSGKGAGQ